jgi:aquaporin Z
MVSHGGCGAAVLDAAFPNLGIGFLGVALAFGLTVLTMAFAIGHISGCHLNPAVSIGLAAGKRFPASELWAYIVAQVAGGIAAAGVLYVIASGKAAFDVSAGFASNGYGAHSPGGYPLASCLTAEVVLTFMFLSAAALCAVASNCPSTAVCGSWAVAFLAGRGLPESRVE